MNIRRFKLEKGTQAYNLMDTKHFFNVPNGLGFDVEYNVLRSGEAFIKTNEKQAQKSIDGELIFINYAEYSAFINFIGDNKGLNLAYSVDNGSTWHNIPVSVGNISKGEISDNGRLICQITFIAWGLWYTQKNYIVNTENHNIQNGVVPSPCRIVFQNGTATPIDRLEWSSWQDVDGVLTKISSGVWVAPYNALLTQGQQLIIDSNPLTMEMARYDENNNYISNEYANGDFTTERFLYIPSGLSTFIANKRCSLGVKSYEFSV